MKNLERRLAMIELKQQSAGRFAAIQIDDKLLKQGISAKKQIADQEAAIGFPVPPDTRHRILTTKPRPGGLSVHFFNDNEV